MEPDQISISEVRSGSAWVMFQVSPPATTPVNVNDPVVEVESTQDFATQSVDDLLAAIETNHLDVDGDITDPEIILTSSDPEPENPEPTAEEVEEAQY